MVKKKSLNKRKLVEYIMNNRGQIIEVFGILILLGIALFGTSQIYLYKDSSYFGDNSTLKVYPYDKCKEFIKLLPQENIIAFASKEEIPNGYILSECI